MGKKIVLVNALLRPRLVRMNIPMGLLCIGTYAFDRGYEVVVLDANNVEKSYLFDRLAQELNDDVLMVGMSIMTAQLTSAVEIAARVREINPSIPIAWGGVHPTLYPEQVASSQYVDYAVKGEGENTLIELLAAIENQSDPSVVNGISFQSDGEVVTTSAREPMDLNDLPFPKWDLLDGINSEDDLAEVAHKTSVGLPIMTSRGCPHRCSFCINPILGQRYRFRSAELVVNDIRTILNTGVTRISFFDEDFFANKKRLIEIMDRIEAEDLKFRWFASGRADYFREHHISPELLVRLKNSGCQQIGIGAESGSQRILDVLKKDIEVEDIMNTARRLNEVGIDATFSFMIGLPGEQVSDMHKTVSLISRITAINDSFRILGPFIYRPYPGSELYEKCMNAGMQVPATIEEWGSSPYIGNEIMPKDYHLFPWVNCPMKDLTNLAFYCWMSGLKVRTELATAMARKLAALRCNHMFFKLPVERSIVRFVSERSMVKALSVGKFD